MHNSNHTPFGVLARRVLATAARLTGITPPKPELTVVTPPTSFRDSGDVVLNAVLLGIEEPTLLLMREAMLRTTAAYLKDMHDECIPADLLKDRAMALTAAHRMLDKALPFSALHYLRDYWRD